MESKNRSFILILFLFVGLFFLTITAFGSRSDTARDTTFSSRKLLGRTTWDGDDVSSKFCAMDDEGNCHWAEYADAMSKNFLTGIVLAFLSIVAGAVFFIGRCFCNCWGGKMISHGICCPIDHDILYSRKILFLIKVLLLVIALGIVACAIVGFLGNNSVNSGLDNMVVVVIDTASSIVAKATAAGEALKRLSYTESEGEKIIAAAAKVQDFLNNADGVKSYIDKYNRYREAFLSLSYAFPLVLIILGGVAAIFHLRWVSMVAAFFCFGTSFWVWLSFGTHYTVKTVFSDACVEIDDYFARDRNNPNATTSSPLDYLVSCSSGNGSALQAYENLAQEGLDMAYSAACSATESLCSASPVNCNQSFEGENCTKDALITFLNSTITDFLIGCSGDTACPSTNCSTIDQVVCYQANVTVKECATSCQNQQERDLSNTTVANVELLIDYINIAENELQPLLNCTYVQGAIQELNDALCKAINSGVDKIAISSGITGVLLIPGTILLIIGFKRFRDVTDLADFEL